MKKGFLLVCSLLLAGFLFVMVPSKASALPVLQVYAVGGTAGDNGQDEDTWFVNSSPMPLQVVVWQNGYTGTSDRITNLYLLATVLEGEAAPEITGLTASLYMGIYPNNHYPMNRPDDFDYYQYLIDDVVSFDMTGLPDYNAATPGDDEFSPNARGHIYELVADVSRLTFAHFDAFATGYQYDRRGNLKNNFPVTEFSPGSHDSSYNPVPEPATMLLLGFGLVGLAGFGRRKLFKNG